MARTRRRLHSYTIRGINQSVRGGDCVLMRASDPGKPPFMGKIELMQENEMNTVAVTVRRYYRPEESIGGRREYHGRKELFLSDQVDTQNALTIEAKCNVHSLDNYLKLDRADSLDFYCRFEYNASTGIFDPDTFDECCNCKIPYNPDNFLVCKSCKDRFHPGCVNVSDDEAKNLKQFTCSKCLSNKKPPKALVPRRTNKKVKPKRRNRKLNDI